MLAADIPANFPIPFANSAGAGYIRTIPEASQISITPGAASLTDGFPPLNFSPVSAGGVPPFGQDFNGILFEMSSSLRWLQAGGMAKYDAAFSTAIGGYPQGAILQKADKTQFWRSLVDNNTTNPETGGANWVLVGRIRLTADVTVYVATTGSNSNSGLVIGSPFLTVQYALEVLRDNYDLAGYTATVSVANGTYSSADNLVNIYGEFTGAKAAINVKVVGNIATPANVVFNTNGASGACVVAASGAKIHVEGMKFTGSAASARGLLAANGGEITFGLCDFGAFAATGVHIYSVNQGSISAVGNYTISGGAAYHYLCGQNSQIFNNGFTVTLTGTPNFVQQFGGSQFGYLESVGATFSGATTGSRYGAQLNGLINTGGGGANYFPGNSAGTTATGGLYI